MIGCAVLDFAVGDTSRRVTISALCGAAATNRVARPRYVRVVP